MDGIRVGGDDRFTGGGRVGILLIFRRGENDAEGVRGKFIEAKRDDRYIFYPVTISDVVVDSVRVSRRAGKISKM